MHSFTGWFVFRSLIHQVIIRFGFVFEHRYIAYYGRTVYDWWFVDIYKTYLSCFGMSEINVNGQIKVVSVLLFGQILYKQ